jgi:hypothetical protein
VLASCWLFSPLYYWDNILCLILLLFDNDCTGLWPIVWKQIQLTISGGIGAKPLFKTKVPCQVINEIRFVVALGRLKGSTSTVNRKGISSKPGKIMKKSATFVSFILQIKQGIARDPRHPASFDQPDGPLGPGLLCRPGWWHWGRGPG